MTPYPAYKSTNLPWLPKIPEHWGVVRAKNLFTRMNRPVSVDDEVITCFRDGEVTLRKKRRLEGFTESLKEIGYQGICPGDLVIHQMDAFAGAIGVSDSKGKGTPVYICLQPKGSISNWYYAYLLRYMAKSRYIKALYRGIRERSSDFRWETMCKLDFPVPVIDEQEQIVRYLDSMTAKINKLIRAKKKQIALLQEQRQAIINQAVTKGLAPNVEMKDSGIDWLGEIPTSWGTCRCKYLFRETNNRSVSGQEEHLSMSQKYGLIPDSRLDGHHLLSESYEGGKICQKDDLVLNRLKAHLGVFALAPQKGVVSPDYTIFHVRKDTIEPLFAEYVLKSQKCRPELKLRVRGIVEGFWRLYTDDFYNITLPLPPLAVQKELLDAIEKQTESINKTISLFEEEISTLKEYHDICVSSVVTGQIDVRTINIELFDSSDLSDEIEEETITEDHPEQEMEE